MGGKLHCSTNEYPQNLKVQYSKGQKIHGVCVSTAPMLSIGI